MPSLNPDSQSEACDCAPLVLPQLEMEKAFHQLETIVFNSLKRTKTGGDWEGVYSANLNTRELAVCVSPEKLRLSEAHGRLWIPGLVSLSEDARTLHVNIGVEKIVSGGGIVHYYLAKVDLLDQQVTLLSRLLDTRF